MTLTTHMAIAAAVAKPFARAHPILGFCAAIASHYLSDAIPHWDYRLRAITDMEETAKDTWRPDNARAFRRTILGDVRRFALDGFLGATLVLICIKPVSGGQWLWVGAAIIGSCLPDFGQGLYLAGFSFLKPLQRFHDRMHTKIRLGPYPAVGIPFQAIILLLSLYFLV